MNKLGKIIGGFVGTILMAYLGNAFYDRFKDVAVLSSILKCFSWMYDGIKFIVLLQVPFWVICLVAIVVFVLYRQVLIMNWKPKGKPAFLNYTTAIIWKWKWKWDYRLSTTGYQIDNLTAFCPKCDIQLLYGRDMLLRSLAYCPKCRQQYMEQELELANEVQMILNKKISDIQNEEDFANIV